MKRLFFLFSLFLPLALTACGGDDDETSDGGGNNGSTASIKISEESLSFSGEAGQKTITVEANHEWAATSDVDWITLSPKNSTSASTNVTISVQKNGQFDARKGTITFMCGSARAYVTVTQDGGDGVPDPNAIICPLPGYSLVWNDEFKSGSVPDPNMWTHQVANAGWVNHELQNYVDGETPDGRRVTDISGGKLRIKCFKENGKVYSGRIYGNVKQGWTYGYIEAKIKLPKGKGTWPAFWMMPVNFKSWPADGEIDIMEEVGVNPNYVSSSLHANAHVHSNNTQVTHEMYCEGAEDDFHVYGIEWRQDKITTYVDGNVQLEYENRGLGRDDWPYDAPFYVILNLAWGGDWGGWNGVDDGALPAVMEVDYVRVFQKK